MTLETLKKSIEDKSIQPSTIIFKISENDFLPMQYAKECSKIWGRKISYINSIDNYCSTRLLIFGDEESKDLEIYKTDCLNKELKRFPESLFIITKKIDKDIEKLYSNIIIDIPKLESWQIQQYAYGQLSLDHKALDWLSLCCKDIYQLENEIDKYRLFDEKEQKIIFKSAIDDGMYEKYTNFTIWDFTNSIINRETESLCSIYKKIETIDIDPIGLVTILLTNFRKIISIQLSANATPESTNIQAKQFYAIKNNCCGKYKNKDLIRIYKFLLGIDYKIKTGLIDTKILIDYVVSYILSYSPIF